MERSILNCVCRKIFEVTDVAVSDLSFEGPEMDWIDVGTLTKEESFDAIYGGVGVGR